MRRRKRRRHIAKQAGQRLAAELRGQDLGRVLIVPIDGGKHSHKALIANALGDILEDTFEFDNNLVGAVMFDKEVQRAARQVESTHVFVGVEPTGHYVENFVQELLKRNYEVRELNPYSVRCEREAGLTWCKTDDLDLCTIGQLLLNGKGRPAEQTSALYYNLRQAVRARRSSVRRRADIQHQIHSYMDRLFPGLLTTKVFGDPFGVAGLSFMRHYGNARRVKRTGKSRLSRWFTQHRISQAEEKATALIELAGRCILLPPSAEEALLQALRFRLEEHQCLSSEPSPPIGGCPVWWTNLPPPCSQQEGTSGAETSSSSKTWRRCFQMWGTEMQLNHRCDNDITSLSERTPGSVWVC